MTTYKIIVLTIGSIGIIAISLMFIFMGNCAINDDDCDDCDDC